VSHGPARLARVFLAIEQFSRRHYRLVLLSGVGVFLIGTALSLTLHFQTDILELLPQKDPAVHAFRETVKTFGALDPFPIVLVAEEGYEAEDLEGWADALAERLRADPTISSVETGIDSDSPLISYVQERLPLFLDDEGLDELRARLSDEAIAAGVADARGLLNVVPSPELKELLRRDPLRLSTILLNRFTGARGSALAQGGSGRIISKDGRALMLIVHPARPAQDVASAKELVARVDAALAETRDEFVRRDAELPPPHILKGGRYAISVEDSNLILSDIGKTMTFAFLGVVALYLFCYRRLGAIAYSVLPLILGQCLTFTLARLAFGSLNSATATSAALLMGLGTDFTIVMYARYVEERRAGKTLDEASKIMMGETALGVYTGALTSAGTFGALLVTSFVGLRQFGLLVGSGILLCLVSILVLLPALVIAFESRREKGPLLYVHSFGFERLIPLSRRHPRIVLAACLALTVVAIPLALRLRLNESVEDLRSKKNQGILDQERIKELFGTDPNSVMVVIKGTDEAEVDIRARRVQARLEEMRDEGRLARVDGIAMLLPDVAAQERTRQHLISSGSDFDPVRIEATLRAALRENGLREDGFAVGIEALRRTLRPDSLVTEAGLSSNGGEELVARFVRSGAEPARVTYAFGDVDQSIIDEIHAFDAGATVAGVNLLSRSLKKVLRRDVVLCLALGFVIVAVLLALDFGSMRLAGLALAQLVFGLTWMFGAMGAFHVKLTMINSFAAALLLGVGIDYGIHLLHRLAGPDQGGDEAIAETGKAVAMAAMTNVVGFGVLLFSNYPGLKGLGLAAVLGSTGCLLSALTLLPALERITARRGD
jgi:predicted RND superfamily exporter protein